MEYADNMYAFRDFLSKYCKDLNIKFPEYTERKKIRLAYKASLTTAPVSDDEMTLMQFLDATYLKKVNEEKMNLVENSICAFEMKYSAPVPMPCEPALPWKGYAGKKKVAECCNQEKEDTMNYNEIEASRKYLNQRASDTFYTKERDLSKQFKLNKPERPQTYKDLIDAIKNGNYELDTKKTAQIDGYVEDEGYYFGSMLEGIVWKLPDGPDRDGFDAAMKAVKAALTVAKDVINTQDSAAGLKALQDFEAWTYTAPTATA